MRFFSWGADFRRFVVRVAQLYRAELAAGRSEPSPIPAGIRHLRATVCHTWKKSLSPSARAREAVPADSTKRSRQEVKAGYLAVINTGLAMSSRPFEQPNFVLNRYEGYLLGYLTLRFQLSTYGVATNLDIFDEKYLFAGCRFLVYLVSSVPNILIIILLIAAIGYVPYRLVSASVKDPLKRRISDWSARPIRLPRLGVVLGVALIQFALRRCFSFGNVLLCKQLPDEWLSSVLLASDGKLSLYFTGLVAGTLLTGAFLLFALRRGTATTFAAKLIVQVLGFLVAVEFLLLPVNYGVLISTQQLPRVAEISGDKKLQDDERGWLVWDSKDALTYLVRTSDDQRTLVTVPSKDAKIRIVAYDDIFCALFGANDADSRSCPREKTHE